jgi:hypothetical protein
MQSASRLAQTLGDHSRAAELENLPLEIGSRIRDMELNKNFLENRLDEQLQAISEQRAELDRKEKEAITTMLQEDQENKLLMGSFLEDAVKTTIGLPDEIGSVASTNIVNGAHESDGDNGDEHKNVVVHGLMQHRCRQSTPRLFTEAIGLTFVRLFSYRIQVRLFLWICRRVLRECFNHPMDEVINQVSEKENS